MRLTILFVAIAIARRAIVPIFYFKPQLICIKRSMPSENKRMKKNVASIKEKYLCLYIFMFREN